jgi:hypothetical protein
MAERRSIRIGDIALVQARPNYWGTVIYSSENPAGKVTIYPHPGQGVTDRKRTVWKDKIIESRPVAMKEVIDAE